MLLNTGFPRRLQIVIQLIAATALLLIPMFYNGCPLYYPDSMGYIFWGQLWQPVPERVSTYALFIRFFSAGRDLWFPVIAQTLIISYLLRRIWIQLTGKDPDGFFYAAFFGLGLLSPLGWTASTLMPDLFCVSSSLFLYLLLFPGEGKKPSWWHIAGFVFTASQHLSNLMINGALLFIFIMVFFLKGKIVPRAKGIIMAAAALLMSFTSIGLVHKLLSGEFFLSKSGQVFMTGRLLETGIASRYLDQHPGEMLPFQQFRKRLPMSSEYFLWNENSPLAAIGGIWDKAGNCADFNRAVLSSPSNLILFVKAGVKSAFKQMFLLNIGDGLRPALNPQLYYYPENLAENRLSRQSTGIDFVKLNDWCTGFLVLLVLLFFTLNPKVAGLTELGFFIITLLLINALVNGALSTPLNRYQVRVFWLIYFWLLAALYPAVKNLSSYFRNQQT
jgi:hypothetical protein